MAKAKEKTPAQIAYDEENPPFATRTTKDFMELEKKMMQETGLSRGELLRTLYMNKNKEFEAAIEKKVNEQLEAVLNDGIKKGIETGKKEVIGHISEREKAIADRRGFDRAREKFGFFWVCDRCGEKVYILAENSYQSYNFRCWLAEFLIPYHECADLQKERIIREKPF